MAVRMQRDPADPFRSVVDGEETGHTGQQRLCRADIGGRPFALDMLFAGLQRHAQRLVAEPVDRYADDAARHIPFIGVLRSQESGVRASESHRKAEPLGRSHGDVRAPFAGGFQQGQGQDVRHGGDQDAPAVCCCGEIVVIADRSVRCRVLDDHPELAAGKLVPVVAVADDFDAERFAARQQQVERLRKDVFVDEQNVAPLLDRFARTQGVHHQHRFGGGRRFVQQRTVADFHAGQRNDRRLEIQQRFQPSLRNFGLIRRIRGIPGRILENVPLDHGRRSRSVIAHADQTAVELIFAGNRANMGGELVFAHSLRRQV